MGGSGIAECKWGEFLMISSSFTLYRNLNSEDTTTTTLYVTYDTETDVPVPVHAALSSPSIDPISGAPTSTQVGWSKSGCELTKWATSRDGTGSSILPGEYPDISDSAFWGYALYAVWEEPSIDYIVTNSELASIADAIREKGGTSETMSFPTGFVSAIQAIPSGGGEEMDIVLKCTNTNGFTNNAADYVWEVGSFDSAATKFQSGSPVSGIAYCNTASYDDEDEIWSWSQMILELGVIYMTGGQGWYDSCIFQFYSLRTSYAGSLYVSRNDDPEMTPSYSYYSGR